MAFCLFTFYLPNSSIVLVSYFFPLILLIFLCREPLITNRNNFSVLIPLNSVSGMCHLKIQMAANNKKTA